MYYNAETKKFQYQDGTDYDGNNESVKQLTKALQTLQAKKNGAKLVKDLADNPNTVEIRSYKEDKNVKRKVGNYETPNDSGSSVYWAYNRKGAFRGKNFVSLAHELTHSLDRMNGTLNEEIWFCFINNDGTKIERTKAEIHALHMENLIRAEHGLPLRKRYVDDQGHWGVTGDEFIKYSNRSLYYNLEGVNNPNFTPNDDKEKMFKYE